MKPSRTIRRAVVTALLLPGWAGAGPYAAGLGDPANAFDAPVPGFTGPHGAGQALEITETAAGMIRSVEVIRQVAVRVRHAAADRRFYRVKISRP